MTKNDKNVTRAYLEKLKQENKNLKKDNQVLGDELTYFKERCADLEEENLHFKAKNLALIRRANYFNSSEAGRDFARELVGGA